jgi:hypothetical protein
LEFTVTTKNKMTTKQLEGIFAVRDPNGNIVHTTVSTSAQGAIDEWMLIESSMNDFANMIRTLDKKPRKCFQSWEGYESQGYGVIPVKLSPI